ncbi:unnamed protein product [Lepeophtheirus salmonis]|uniref:(salmon louse) hypothetical protein n=1 Tax=Lepeophtheirus salmonis TaxID=72036 RepID=A0A7R8CKD7_LEPSM|nr:unnamed protein product [Lepeophtheirus salmonis]CAF2815081.1 unnamed protein product [Lepeophtheirus salmonis]
MYRRELEDKFKSASTNGTDYILENMGELMTEHEEQKTEHNTIEELQFNDENVRQATVNILSRIKKKIFTATNDIQSSDDIIHFPCSIVECLKEKKRELLRENEQKIFDTLPHPRNLRHVDELVEAENLAREYNLRLNLAVTDKDAKKEYQMVDAHITNSTHHIKGFAAILSYKFNIENQAGQLFYGTHTTLELSSVMNKRLSMIEIHMTLEAIFKNFLIDLDFYQPIDQIKDKHWNIWFD